VVVCGTRQRWAEPSERRKGHCLEEQGVPLYLDTEMTHWLSPCFLLHLEEQEELEGTLPNPEDREWTSRFLELEGEALRRSADVLRGDFRWLIERLPGFETRREGPVTTAPAVGSRPLSMMVVRGYRPRPRDEPRG
jgi:hypothetical protein